MSDTDLPARVKDKVCIVGFADTRRIVPFDNPDFEFWGINALHRAPDLPGPHWDRWFQLHDIQEHHGKDEQDLANHLEFLSTLKCPVYVRPQDLGEHPIPTQTAYPLQQVVGRFPRYFNNTVSYLIALAILMEYQEIHLYGVDMAQDALTGAEFCVSPDMRVLTADLRWVPADQVKPGDQLVGFDEYAKDTYRTYQTATVLEARQLTAPTYRFHMEDGTKLVSSANHRWLSNYGKGFQWWRTEDMHGPIATPELAERVAAEHAAGATQRRLATKHGMSRAAVSRIVNDDLDLSKSRRHKIIKLVEPWDEDRSWGAGFLAAAFDGEGHLSQLLRPSGRGYAVSLGFSQKPNAMSEAVMRELAARGYFVNGGLSKDGCGKWQISGKGPLRKGCRDEILRFLGSIRPPRLLGRFNPSELGAVHKMKSVSIVEKEYLGVQPVIGLHTTTGTFIAEGFASHNSHQRPSCEFFLGVAMGAGITIHVARGSDLLRTSHLYGFEDGSIIVQKHQARLNELGHRKEQLKAELAQVDGRRTQLLGGIQQTDGAMQDNEYWLRTWDQQPHEVMLLSDVPADDTVR